MMVWILSGWLVMAIGILIHVLLFPGKIWSSHRQLRSRLETINLFVTISVSLMLCVVGLMSWIWK